MASTIIHKTRLVLPHFIGSQHLCGNKYLPTSFLCLVRYKKHYNQKYRKERAAKVLKVFLPNFDEERKAEKLNVEEIRVKLKEKGVAPFRSWNEKPIFISCTGDIFEPYVPPEGDGKISPVSSSGVKQMYHTFGKKSKSYMALRKIRDIDYEFDVPTLAEKAQQIYIDAQNALVAKDEDKLHELVTEKAYMEMMENVKNKSLVWKFIQSLETPRIVQVRFQDMLGKSNSFAQVTLRLHTQQTLTVYDRFGRLMHGSEDVVKDVLEYIVFEKYITHPHGSWRIHAKIIPDWMPPRDAIKKTFIAPDLDKELPEPPPKKDPPPPEDSEQSGNAALATA